MRSARPVLWLTLILPLLLPVWQPVEACSTGVPQAPLQVTPPPDIPQFPPPTLDKEQALIGVEVDLFGPSSTTTCACGIGLGNLTSSLPSSASVDEVVITRFNRTTGQHTVVTEFLPLSLSGVTTTALATGPGAVPGATWFGFSGPIAPFDPPELGDDEVFTLSFLLSFDPADRGMIENLPIQFAAGIGNPDGTPVFDDGREPTHHPVTYFGQGALPDCVRSDTTLCLVGDRFQVIVEWRNQFGEQGLAKVAPCGADDSGILFFFNPDNLEMLLKVLNGCPVNGFFWVFSAATTNVEYTVRVVDTETGENYFRDNPLGQVAETVLDTQAFATCP